MDLLSWYCSQVDVQDVLGASKAAVGQNVLLSLIQQLTCDLKRDTALKALWIREAALALDPAEQLFAVHARPVLGDALDALQHEFDGCQDRQAAGELRLCIHVVRGLFA